MKFPKAATFQTVEEVDLKLAECVAFYKTLKPQGASMLYINKLLDRRNQLGGENTLTKPEEPVESSHEHDLRPHCN